jgi:inorganic pyrophosphatase
LEHFATSSTSTTSIFQEKKTAKGPSVAYALEIAEFSSAKSAVDKDLTNLLGTKPPGGDLVYSVHYSDINGLSRLENNILAHEIFEFLGM